MLLLDNDAVEASLSVGDCIAAIRFVYAEANRGGAAFRPRSTFHVARGPEQRFTFATMEGVSAQAEVAAIRIRSDFVTNHPETGHETKYSTQPGDYCGLVLLFSTANAEPLAILNDGYLQHLRVAATAAVAGDLLARRDARVLTIIGAGGMAHAHLLGYAAIRPLERILVHSRTPASREALAAWGTERTGIPVEAVDDPARAVAEADIVATCTSSTRPVIDARWIRPGTHISSVRHWSEIGPDIVQRADRVVIHETSHPTPYVIGDPTALEASRVPRGWGSTPYPEDVPSLADLLADPAHGRGSDDEVTYFLNSIGTGIQFAACAGLAYRHARDLGLGREIPTAWFLQQIPD